MDIAVDDTVFSSGSRARARFAKSKAKAREFLKKKRNYQRPDFPRMILDLRQLGWSHEKIAYMLNISNGSTISAWATGTRPFFENGEQFIMLWQDQTGLDRFPREGECRSYQYWIKQLNLLDDLDNLIEQLDEEILK